MKNTALFLPGIRFMQKLKFFPKIVTLVAVMLIPICVLAYFLHVEIKKVTDFAEQERSGVQYILPLSEILIELSGGMSQDISLQKLEPQIAAIDKNDAALGAELKTTAAWKELKPLLQQAANPKAREAAIAKTVDLIAIVGDSSNLVLDPDMDSYYIMDAAIVKYPDILSKTNQLSVMATGSMAKTQKTVDDQISAAMVEGAIRSTLDGAKTGLKNAANANPSLKEGMAVFAESETATSRLLKLIDDSLLLAGGDAAAGKSRGTCLPGF